MKRFEPRNVLAGTLQPGDSTRYEMIAVRFHTYVVVIVLNYPFFDRITFLIIPDEVDNLAVRVEFYQSFCKSRTNPWTIRAAQEMAERLLGIYREDTPCVQEEE
jgi:hypothetical protein